MAEEEKAQSKPKKKHRSKVDIPTVIFMVLIVVGLIACTYLAFRKPDSVIYKKEFGDISVLIEFYNKNNDIDLAIDTADGRVLQQGKYETTKEENKYVATFKDSDGDLKVDIVIKDKTLTMIYEDGSEITLEET